jgi:hypothetical protein
MVTTHRASSGSKQWNRVAKAWKELGSAIRVNPPSNYDEWISSSFWWNGNSYCAGPKFSRERMVELHHTGIQHIREVWKENSLQFISANEVRVRFSLRLVEHSSCDRVCKRHEGVGGRL